MKLYTLALLLLVSASASAQSRVEFTIHDTSGLICVEVVVLSEDTLSSTDRRVWVTAARMHYEETWGEDFHVSDTSCARIRRLAVVRNPDLRLRPMAMCANEKRSLELGVRIQKREYLYIMDDMEFRQRECEALPRGRWRAYR